MYATKVNRKLYLAYYESKGFFIICTDALISIVGMVEE